MLYRIPCLALFVSMLVLLGAPIGLAEDTALLGAGPHQYEWVSGWMKTPDGNEIGNTHGAIAFDSAGNVYVNTDHKQAILVFRPDGTFVRALAPELTGGMHGMDIVREGDEEFLYATHTGQHAVVKMKLDGTIVWRIGTPEKSGVYKDPNHFRPTSVAVAPDGRFFVADGYGLSYVHLFDKNQKWIRTFGGPGTEPGKFRTPHGLWIDKRVDPPVLIVADRENHRLQKFDLEGNHLGVIEGFFRRPCKVHGRGSDLVVADLAGRVTILDGNDELVTHLGDNPDPGKRARNDVAKTEWVDGHFLSPHAAAWDAEGNLYVMDWNRHGRITKLKHVAPSGKQ